MSIYGILMESNNVDENTCYFDYVYESAELVEEAAKLPQELKLTEEDIFSASKFKSKTQAILKFFEENNYKPKKISKTVYMWYYAIIGNTFSGNCKKYEPKLSYYASIAKKYCDSKQLKKIRTDIEKTIASLEKMQAKKNLNDLQVAWLKDIKSNVNKF